MVAGDAPVQTVRRRSEAFSGPRLDWWLAGAALAIGIVIYLTGDRTNWSGGFGFDGRFYGELAKNFPSAVFGHGTTVPPGFEPYTGPHLIGVDSYYIFRIVPSGLVWLALKVTTLSPTDGHVIALFAGLNAFMYALATWCWCRSAALLRLGDREKILGATALLINFAVLRTGAYLPVLTDQVALGLGGLSLYLWLRGYTPALAVTVFLGCFTWPLTFLVGGLLLLFPAPLGVDFSGAAEPRGTWGGSWRLSPWSAAVALLAAVAALVVIVVVQSEGRVASTGAPQLAAFPLSAAITGLFTFGVFAYFLPPEPRDLLAMLRALRPPRVVLTIAVLAAARILGAILSRRGGLSSGPILEEELWWTTLGPGLFIVILISYFGPLMLALLADLARAGRDSWRLGPGMATVVAVGLLGALTTQPRQVVNVLPFLLLPGVLAIRRSFGLGNAVLAAFFVISLIFSRIWLYIGPIPTEIAALEHFPAQSYYMALGPWTPVNTYWMQLGGVLLTLVVGAGALGYRRRPRRAAHPR
jgi:hypothetical protein